MKQAIKLNERQLRNIIRESIGEILNEGMYESRPRKSEKPSYWDIPDYREVPGAELYIEDPRKCANERYKTPEGLKNAFKYYGALRAYIDRNGGVHAFFYSGGWPKYAEIGNAWDEDTWYKIMKEPTMKGVAKRRIVKLNDYVPGFDKIWAEKLKRTQEDSKREDEEQFGGRRRRSREAATAYNTIPTIGSL